MIHMLSTQALLDLITNEPALVAWRKTVPPNMVEISAVAVGHAIAVIEATKDAARRADARRALDDFVGVVASYQGVIPFDDDAARIWAGLQAMDLPSRSPGGKAAPLGTESRMVVAACIGRGATLVDPAQPYHSKVPLTVVSP